MGSPVSLRVVTTDRYGRVVAEVFKGSTNINLAMVARGGAVVYRDYLGGCDRNTYLGAEDRARGQGLGFWGQETPVMPWVWRRKN